MNKIIDVNYINLDMIEDFRGKLVPIEFEKNFDISIKRSFLVFGNRNVIRGNHAHIKCNQFLCCISGGCEIKYDDGKESDSQLLDNPSKILKIPNMIWSSQKYNLENTILLVLCDQDFSEKDYIRDYEVFIDYRKKIKIDFKDK